MCLRKRRDKTPSPSPPRRQSAGGGGAGYRGREPQRALLAVDEALELLRPARVPQLAERLGLDLPDALAGHLEVLADLLEGVIALLADAEAHAQDLLLARRQGLEHLPRLLGE